MERELAGSPSLRELQPDYRCSMITALACIGGVPSEVRSETLNALQFRG